MIEQVGLDDYSTKRLRQGPDEFKHVKFKVEGSVARLTLNRPEHNLLNEAMLRELSDGVSVAGDREDVKLIVLDSACKVFCGGIDIGEYTSQRVFQMLDAFHAAFRGDAGSGQAGDLRGERSSDRGRRGACGVW